MDKSAALAAGYLGAGYDAGFRTAVIIKPAVRAKQPTECKRTVIWLARNRPGVVKSFSFANFRATAAIGSVAK